MKTLTGRLFPCSSITWSMRLATISPTLSKSISFLPLAVIKKGTPATTEAADAVWEVLAVSISRAHASRHNPRGRCRLGFVNTDPTGKASDKHRRLIRIGGDRWCEVAGRVLLR